MKKNNIKNLRKNLTLTSVVFELTLEENIMYVLFI